MFKKKDRGSEYFSLRAGILQAGNEYKIRATWRSANSYGFAEETVKINYPPYNGQCKVEPNQGILSLKYLMVGFHRLFCRCVTCDSFSNHM